jgi:hypothetical protein
MRLGISNKRNYWNTEIEQYSFEQWVDHSDFKSQNQMKIRTQLTRYL